MEVVVIYVALSVVGGLGFVMMTAPLPATEYDEVPYRFRADTLA